LFFDNTLPYPVAGINFKEHKANIPGTGKELFSLTSREDIGRFVAAILKQPDVTKDKVIRIAGDTVTANTLVEKYEKQLGKKFDVAYRPADEIDRVAQEGLKTGNLGAYFSNRIPLFTGTGVFSASLDCADTSLESPT
jgi:nucleoside-diphosphate-sugar epimerase